jgi:mannosyl-oligosaccharide alpha-1,2-mannosidase
MARLRFISLGALLFSSAIALPRNDPINLVTQSVEQRQYTAPVDRAQAVIDTFKLSWEGYYKYAFPNDELKPVSNGFSNSRYVPLPSLLPSPIHPI